MRRSAVLAGLLAAATLLVGRASAATRAVDAAGEPVRGPSAAAPSAGLVAIPPLAPSALPEAAAQAAQEASAAAASPAAAPAQDASSSDYWGDWARLRADAGDRARAEPVTMKGAMRQLFALQRQALKTAEDSPRLGALEAPLARLMLRSRRERLAVLEHRLKTSEDPAQVIFRDAARGRPLSAERRALLEELKAYAPGLDPERAVAGHWEFDWHLPGGGVALGWANRFSVDERGKADSLIGLQHEDDWIGGVKTALHEGFHQGDEGYIRGQAAAELLLGQDGGALATLLIEGYTELRARAALGRLLADGWEGKGGAAAAELALAVRSRSGAKTVEEARHDLLTGVPPHSYDGFVAVAEQLTRQPGGEAALEAFVRRGDLSGVALLLGRERLRALARLAAGREALLEGEEARPYEQTEAQRAVLRSGLIARLDVQLANASGGLLDQSAVDALLKRATALAGALEREASRLGRGGRGWLYAEAARHLDLELPAAQAGLFARGMRAAARRSRLTILGTAAGAFVVILGWLLASWAEKGLAEPGAALLVLLGLGAYVGGQARRVWELWRRPARAVSRLLDFSELDRP